MSLEDSIDVRVEIKTGNYNFYIVAKFNILERVLGFDPHRVGGRSLAILMQKPLDECLFANKIRISEISPTASGSRYWTGLGSPIAYERRELVMLIRVKPSSIEH